MVKEGTLQLISLHCASILCFIGSDYHSFKCVVAMESGRSTIITRSFHDQV